MTQLERAGEEIGRNVYITNMKQKMPQNADWYSFLRNNNNKTELISALVSYFKSEEIRRKISNYYNRRRKDMAFVFNTNTGVTKQQSC